jgi:hypothetical protein
MKAFLMYRDRDFDPQQILARRAREIRRDEGPNLEQLLPWNEQALRQDLGLDILFNAMAAGDNFLFDVAKVAVERHRCRHHTIPPARLLGLLAA